MERERLARVFEQGLDSFVGYVLPLRDHGASTVTSRRPLVQRAVVPALGAVYLIPGDSPMGCRLPLDSLPWAEPADAEVIAERDPMAPHPDVPPLEAFAARRSAPPGARPAPSQRGRRGAPRGVAARAGARSRRQAGRRRRRPLALFARAMCVEPRDGHLYVFMPPVDDGGLSRPVAAVEDTAEQLACRSSSKAIRRRRPAAESFQGHARPGRDRGEHPSRADWEELVRQHRVSTRRRAQTRLGTEKFMIDGRHTGTGGGNHVVLGGAHAADWPFLRRPDLLRACWAIGRIIRRSPTCSPACSSARPASTARGRSPQRLAVRTGNRLPPDRSRGRRCRPGSSTASSATCSSTRPATRTAPILHRQALLARQRDRPAWPGGAARLRDAAALRA